MRRIGFIAPVEFVSGKWAPTATTTYYNGTGVNSTDVTLFVSHRRSREFANGEATSFNYYGIRVRSNFHALSQSEITVRTRFTAISALVRAAYADVTKYPTYVAQWKASGKRMTLRKFIWDQETAIYEATNP